MAFEARLRLRHAGCMSCDLGPGVSVAQLSDEGEHTIFLASADSEEGLEAALEGLRHTLANCRVATRSTLTAVVQGACPPHGIETVIRAYNCSILWPSVFADGHERYRVLAPTRARLKDLVERLAEMGGAEVESVGEARAEALGSTVRLGEVFGQLTTRQLEVLRAAVGRGYYASPRRTSTEELAAAFGISRATLEEHLRKAEVRVLESILGSLADHPATREATRKNARARPKAKA